jgi:surfactin synthase thioesterase subunit
MNLTDLEHIREWDRLVESPGEAVLNLWFPSRNPLESSLPKVIICIHNSGSTESIYTAYNKDGKDNQFILWARRSQIQVLACQLPGREKRQSETVYDSIQDAANGIYAVLRHRLEGRDVQFAIIAHSMGCWVAYELALRLQAVGCFPFGMCLSCFPSPQMDPVDRPWIQSERRYMATRGSAQNQDPRTLWAASLAEWDVDVRILHPILWKKYRTAIEGDFNMLCGYNPTQDLSTKISCPLLMFYATKDRMVTERHVKQWKTLYSGPPSQFQVHILRDCNHMFVADPDACMDWLAYCSRFLQEVVTI